MMLLSIVYNGENEDIINGLEKIKYNFELKNIIVGISECIEGNTHFVKIICSDNDYDDRVSRSFNLYMADLLYNIVVKEFFYKELNEFLFNTYFFLENEDFSKIKTMFLEASKCEGAISNENEVYINNRKNSITKKIVNYLEQNDEINIKGFIRFRMNDFKKDISDIIDKIAEIYMVEKEYDEFIKLLKYFVDIQESKIDEIDIYIKNDGSYNIKDINGNEILDKVFSELIDYKNKKDAIMDDVLISGLITLAPEKIIVHCVNNCINKELVSTIKNVFLDKVEFCDSCDLCKEIQAQYVKS